MLDNIKKAYKNYIESAESLAKMRDLNEVEIFYIIERIGRAEMCALILDGENNDHVLFEEVKKRKKAVVTAMNNHTDLIKMSI